MKTILACIVLAALAPRAAAQSIPASRAADAAQIKREIEIICQAFVDKDRRTLEATHGADWRGFTPESDHVIRGRDGYMNEATFDPRTPKGQGMVGYRISDFDVVFYGDTAVASFVLDVDGVRGTQRVTQKLTILDVFHKEPRRWVQVASNTSYHADEFARRMSQLRPLGDAEKREVLATREGVWRSWFAGDAKQLTSLLAPELITIDSSSRFGSLESNLEASRGFAAGGGRLTRLVFPTTEFQAYGATVILYTTYDMDLLVDGKTRTERGAATEIFVRQGDRWIHTGWQLAPSTR
ncbi:MAG TPA: nuclear transport factor 2 family protein [Vicinamibacterales bacterium]|nr:nuclear transport factor 2 family protein [Vicinamibacterales bacterium]